jgi:hypothetical protein
MHPIHFLDLDQITKLINKSGTAEVVIYEFHRIVASKQYSEAAFEEFQRRSEPSYKTYVGYGIDGWPADTDHVVKIMGEWYIALNSASNYYLGGGPSSLLHLRELCTARKIPIILIECHVMEFLSKKFPGYTIPKGYNYFNHRAKIGRDSQGGNENEG